MLGVFYSVLGFFWLVGFPSPLSFPLYGLQTLVSMFLGGHFVGGMGDLSFGSFGCGPSFLDCMGLDVPCFSYIDPLPDIDHCHDVYSVECNIEID